MAELHCPLTIKEDEGMYVCSNLLHCGWKGLGAVTRPVPLFNRSGVLVTHVHLSYRCPRCGAATAKEGPKMLIELAQHVKEYNEVLGRVKFRERMQERRRG